jgi:hypothetical protein
VILFSPVEHTLDMYALLSAMLESELAFFESLLCWREWLVSRLRLLDCLMLWAESSPSELPFSRIGPKSLLMLISPSSPMSTKESAEHGMIEEAFETMDFYPCRLSFLNNWMLVLGVRPSFCLLRRFSGEVPVRP